MGFHCCQGPSWGGPQLLSKSSEFSWDLPTCWRSPPQGILPNPERVSCEAVRQPCSHSYMWGRCKALKFLHLPVLKEEGRLTLKLDHWLCFLKDQDTSPRSKYIMLNLWKLRQRVRYLPKATQQPSKPNWLPWVEFSPDTEGSLRILMSLRMELRVYLPYPSLCLGAGQETPSWIHHPRLLLSVCVMMQSWCGRFWQDLGLSKVLAYG